MSVKRNYRIREWAIIKEDILDSKGALRVAGGQEAQIVVYDPTKHSDCPHGLRVDVNSTTPIFVSEDQLEKHPTRPIPTSIWTDHPEEYYNHPGNPRYHELRAQGWRIDPATIA